MGITLGTLYVSPEIRAAVNEVLDSERLSYGSVSHELERTFAQLHDRKYGVLSNSGTSSLLVALQAMKERWGWADGAKVLIPAVTFVATVNAVIQAGLRPILVDVDPDYYDMTGISVRDAADQYTVAALPVNVFGKPADLHSIRRICNTLNMGMIEDSCEAVGALAHGDPAGSIGDVGVFSFYMAHVITAGVGGMAVTSDHDVATAMRSLVNHGIETDSLPSPNSYDPTFLSRNFRFDRIGHSFRITEMEAAIALEMTYDITNIVTEREVVAEKITGVLTKFEDDIQLPKVRSGHTSCWMMYPIVLRNETKHNLMQYLRLNDIECRDMLPLFDQPCYRHMDWNAEMFPVAHRINQHGLYIGCHQAVQDKDIENLGKILEGFFYENKRRCKTYEYTDSRRSQVL